MKGAFTLVVPTFNRPVFLAALLRYLEGQRVDFGVLVLDSSEEPARTANRRAVAACAIGARYEEYDSAVVPMEKVRDGLTRVTTPLFAFCADDDVVIPAGTARCVSFMLEHPEASVAHGYYFMFTVQPDVPRALSRILYLTPDIADDDPLWLGSSGGRRSWARRRSR